MGIRAWNFGSTSIKLLFQWTSTTISLLMLLSRFAIVSGLRKRRYPTLLLCLKTKPSRTTLRYPARSVSDGMDFRLKWNVIIAAAGRNDSPKNFSYFFFICFYLSLFFFFFFERMTRLLIFSGETSVYHELFSPDEFEKR